MKTSFLGWPYCSRVWIAPGEGVPGGGNSMVATWKRERGKKEEWVGLLGWFCGWSPAVTGGANG